MEEGWPLANGRRSPTTVRPITPNTNTQLLNAAARARSDLAHEIEQSWSGSPYESSIWEDSSTVAPSPSDRRALSPEDRHRSLSLSPISMRLQYNAAPSAVHSDVSTVVNSPTSTDHPGKEETESVIMQPPPGPPQISMAKGQETLFIINVCLAQFLSLAALAQTVAPILIIGKDLQVQNPGQLSWFTAAFSMTLGTFILPAGKLPKIDPSCASTLR